MCIMGADRNMYPVSAWPLFDLDRGCSKAQGDTPVRQCKA